MKDNSIIILRQINYLVLVEMPVNVEHLKQRINEVLEAKAELNRLTSKPYAD